MIPRQNQWAKTLAFGKVGVKEAALLQAFLSTRIIMY